MNTTYVIIAVLFVSFILSTLFLIREIANIQEMQAIFKCEHCGKINNIISNGHKCIFCNRTYRNKKGAWEHFLLFRVSKIDTSIKKVEYTYKKYTKFPKIQIAMCSIFDIILVLSMLITYIKGGH